MTVAPTPDLFGYFNDRVEAARSEHRARITDEAALYLAHLLTERARVHRDPGTPDTFAELHAHAAAQRPADQARAYRELGDRALYELGYFSDHLERKPVPLDYYASMGSAAYQRVDTVLKRWFADAFGPIFRELSARFGECVAVLGGVRAAHDAEGDLETLYARWLETGAEDVADQLRRAGLVIPRSHGPNDA